MPICTTNVHLAAISLYQQGSSSHYSGTLSKVTNRLSLRELRQTLDAVVDGTLYLHHLLPELLPLIIWM
jgi:hypothetical protein